MNAPRIAMDEKVMIMVDNKKYDDLFLFSYIATMATVKRKIPI
jgi:hypothetical protein